MSIQLSGDHGETSIDIESAGSGSVGMVITGANLYVSVDIGCVQAQALGLLLVDYAKDHEQGVLNEQRVKVLNNLCQRDSELLQKAGYLQSEEREAGEAK